MTDKAPSADVLLFADGACSGNPGPGGWGFILRHPASDKETRDSGATRMTTNNRMELTAVIEGLRALRASRRWRVHVVTDSEYVARGMNEWIAKWIANGWRRGKGRDAAPVLNVDLWKELHGLCSRHEVTFEHVRGHSGHLENEECDRMAAAAIKELRLNG